jgi:predicted dehydrogenase
MSDYLKTKKNKINEVNIYCGSYLPDWRPQKDYLKSYSANKFMGGGVDLDLIHELDYMVWLFGFPEKVLNLKKSSSTLRINSCDSARYLVDYPSFSIGITLNYFRRDSKRCLEVVMQDDTIIVDLNLCEIKSMTSGNIFFRSSYSIMDTYKKQMLHFVKNLASKNNYLNDFENAINVLKLAI